MPGQLAPTSLILLISALSLACIATQPADGGKTAEARPGFSTYTDPTHGFSISFPKGFVVRPQDVSKLVRSSPALVASVFFMNPTMATGDQAGPPDLEVRVYRANGADSVKSWLVSVRFATSEGLAAAKPFRNASVAGLEVCRSPMLAPNCSIYVLRDDRVYQLTPLSIEGTAMIETFALPPGS
ncbi:MAG TPA: hypothetical protein VGS22_29505 [Thermoanaerobaculia bacterium]|nr:hypothetical protein [Thermoanaerobaculia bacterium]